MGSSIPFDLQIVYKSAHKSTHGLLAIELIISKFKIGKKEPTDNPLGHFCPAKYIKRSEFEFDRNKERLFIRNKVVLFSGETKLT